MTTTLDEYIAEGRLERGMHISRPRWTEWSKRRGMCPCCLSRRTMVGLYQEWYGWMVTCLGCGDRWNDGELMPRPFCRGWRQDNIKVARALWLGHA